MAAHKPSVADNLFRLCKVSHIALVIDPTCKVSGSLLFIGTAANQCIHDILFCCYLTLELFNVPLDYWLAPLSQTLLFRYLHQALIEDELGAEFALL